MLSRKSYYHPLKFLSKSLKKSNKTRVKASLCRRKKTAKACRRFKGCKFIRGTKRSYCRKSRNTRRH